MSFRAYILGTRAAELSRQDIAEFIEEGCYLDSPTFAPDSGSDAATELEWNLLEVFETPGSTPVRLHRECADRVALTVDIVVGTCDERGVVLPAALDAQLQATRQVYVVEFDRGSGLSDDAWEMLPSVQAFLARRCNGLVFTSEDGIYSADLSLLVDFRSNEGP